MDNLYNTLVGLTGGDDTTPKEPLDLESLEIGDPVEGSAAQYGWKVEGYNVALSEVGCWRLFYQDTNCTYLISNNLVYKENTTGFKPSDYYTSIYKDENKSELKYRSGADVSTVGQRLNKKLLDATEKSFFKVSNTNPNILATAWLTDPDQWEKYKNEDAEFAIGSPTVELYAASFDAAADAAKKNDPPEERTKIRAGLGVGTYGYTEGTSNELQQSYNHGIYNKSGSSNWWLASPYGDDNYNELCVSGSRFGDDYSYAVRPIVCIQTSIFKTKYESSLEDK